MKKTRFYFILIMFLSLSLKANEGTNAITEDGRGVLLYSNGTWAFKLDPVQPHSKITKKSKILKTKPFLKGKAYKIIYNDKLWKQSNIVNKDAEIQLEHKKGHGYAIVIFDSTPMSLTDLKKQVLTNMRSVVSDVEIIFEKKKQVNGHPMMVLKINSSIEAIPFSYLNYYASGDWGVVQFVTYTATALMASYEADFIDLLNGLTIQ